MLPSERWRDGSTADPARREVPFLSRTCRRFSATAAIRMLKNMLALDNDVGPVSAQRSIFEVVKFAQIELRQLLARREEVSWRIRNLRRVMDGFETSASHPASARIPAERFAGSPRFLSRSRSNQPYLSLRRACRIALMEGEESASALEMHGRIAHRGSFLFVNSESAVSSIVRMLNSMTADGEVGCLEDSRGPRWYRILRE
jgi:hypothetical protein